MKPTTALKAALTTLAIASAPALTGCSTAGEGAVSGAGLGALTGLVLGSFSGNPGEGAVIGTAAGAVFGGVIGDQNEREARYSQQQAEAYRSGQVIYRDAPQQPSYRQDGWNDRYGQTQTTYNEYHYYEQRPAESRVIIRYDNRPTYRTRYYPRRSYRDPYCR